MKPQGNHLKSALAVAGAAALSSQWIFLQWNHIHLPVPWNALLPGMAVFGAAFLLSWGAELAQLEIPQALALAILALIAVLPEYAVDMYFAWEAGKNPAYIAYATANMTGSNRLLIGIGWPTALFAYWLGNQKRKIVLEQAQAVEIAVLFIATVYSFLIPLKGTLSMWDTFFFISLFIFYMVSASRSHHVEPELGGPSEWIGQWLLPARRTATAIFFLLAGYVIFIAAKPFAEGLLSLGRAWGVEEFVLVQWLAPLASESPEFIVAIFFALRGMAGAAMGTLISSKVNQWTLLIGMLPLAFSISGGHAQAMPLDKRQIEEIFLTSAQSFLAVSVLSNFRLEWWEAAILIVLFSVQMLIPSPQMRYLFAGLYLILAAVLLLGNRERRKSVLSLLTQSWKPAR